MSRSKGVACPQRAHRTANAAQREFVGIFPTSTKDLRGTAHVCGCGELAVCEKAGRTVCRECANQLKGMEYPLRTGRWRRGMGDIEMRAQLGMIQHRPGGDLHR
jgi:hypothetical protein